jgi:hypothetical protein
MARTLTQTIIDKFLAMGPSAGTMVADEVDELRPLFAEFATFELALLELHASMLRHASRQSSPEEFTDPAAIVVGLVRAIQQARQAVPDEVVLTTVAHAMCGAVTAGWDPGRSRHLNLARSWLAHADLIAGAEGGDVR